MSNEERRTIVLNEVLTPQQLEDVDSLVAKIRVGQVKLDTLRFYFAAESEHLAKHDIDASYLFYAVAYAYNLF